jgi:hypothetical protein
MKTETLLVLIGGAAAALVYFRMKSQTSGAQIGLQPYQWGGPYAPGGTMAPNYGTPAAGYAPAIAAGLAVGSRLIRNIGTPGAVPPGALYGTPVGGYGTPVSGGLGPYPQLGTAVQNAAFTGAGSPGFTGNQYVA